MKSEVRVFVCVLHRRDVGQRERSSSASGLKKSVTDRHVSR